MRNSSEERLKLSAPNGLHPICDSRLTESSKSVQLNEYLTY